MCNFKHRTIRRAGVFAGPSHCHAHGWRAARGCRVSQPRSRAVNLRLAADGVVRQSARGICRSEGAGRASRPVCLLALAVLGKEINQ
mmetsp:Transcript_57332/g.177701  ORF Transcript_57332/g.177701 Transcript_57332/m.177701 type:complete len:87 (+) Transcript_57332:87-347(+)